MHVCKFPIRKPIRDYSWEFSVSFKAPLGNFEIVLKIWLLYSVSLQLRLKGDFSKHTIHVLNLPTELQNAEASFILLKSDPTTEALPEILGSSKGNIYGVLPFRYSCCR